MVAVEVRSANRLLLLDPVLPACTVQFLVEDPRPRPFATQGSHDETGAARTRQPFRLRDHPPRPAPRRSGPVTEVAEPPRRRAGRDAAAARLAQLPADALDQAGFAGQAEQVVDPIVFAPRPVAAKAAVAANDDFGLRPTLANARPRQLLRRARRRVDVRRPQPRTQGRPGRAAGSSKSRSSRGSDAPPGCRAPGRRWSRCPGRSRGDGQASRDRSTLRSSIAPAATFLYRCTGASRPRRARPDRFTVPGQRNAAVALPNPLLPGQVARQPAPARCRPGAGHGR